MQRVAVKDGLTRTEGQAESPTFVARPPAPQERATRSAWQQQKQWARWPLRRSPTRVASRSETRC